MKREPMHKETPEEAQAREGIMLARCWEEGRKCALSGAMLPKARFIKPEYQLSFENGYWGMRG